MLNILPFKRTSQLIREIDEFIDKVSEAAMVCERTFLTYLADGPGDYLEERLEEIMEIEARADELRRNVSKVMFTEMLMPDTRGDVLSLGAEVDASLDDLVHLLGNLCVERPEIPPEYTDGFRRVTSEVMQAVDSMLRGARAYFKEPNAVRDHIHKINFQEKEATQIVLRTGRKIFDSELPLERKRQLRDWLRAIRTVASRANDIGGRLEIFAVKRSL